MNYLAHLFFAQPSVESHVGNLLGDFMRGVKVEQLPHAVRLGLDNHRLVDAYTDKHAEVKCLKRLISPQRRRFAGIMLDMVFDHYLIKHWHRYSDISFEQQCQGYYRKLAEGQVLMPAPMQSVTQRVISQDWFSSYAQLQGVGYALDRIAARLRFRNDFSGAIDELSLHQQQIEVGFLRFFPELVAEVTRAGLELKRLG